MLATGRYVLDEKTRELVKVSDKAHITVIEDWQYQLNAKQDMKTTMRKWEDNPKMGREAKEMQRLGLV